MDKELAGSYLKRCCAWAVRSRFEPFMKPARSIKAHWYGIVNYHRTKMTAGFMEGLNGIVQTAKREARGYRNSDNFVLIIHLIAGKLPLKVTHSI